MAYDRTWTALLLWVLLWNTGLLYAANVTEKAVSHQNNTTSPPTTVAVKVNVTASTLCKKCSCDAINKQLDCRNKSMHSLFSSTEWEILQKGDLTFETIRLEHNNISFVPQWPSYPVKNLYLSFNQIHNISSAAFQNLSQLKKLDLSHNKLTSKSLKPHVFQGHYSSSQYQPLSNMRELDLGYNELHSLNSDLFEHLPNLEALILCKNTFHVIDVPTVIAIAELTSLKTLDISYMELSTLPDNFLHGPRDLEVLIMSGNLFKTLPPSLKLSKNLKQLVLDENPITDFVGNNVFPPLHNLRYLSISFLNDVTKVGKGALSNLQNLTTLVAVNNPNLVSIDENAFARNTSNPDILDYPPLEKLYLHNNNLSRVEHNWIRRWDKIQTIDLRLNPWVCDCTNSWLIHSLMTQINNTTPLLARDVACGWPASWKNKPLLELTVKKKLLVCENASHPENDSLILVGILVGVLIGIPLTLGSLVIYRRGCFGLLRRGNTGGHRTLYNRASFSDDFHI